MNDKQFLKILKVSPNFSQQSVPIGELGKVWTRETLANAPREMIDVWVFVHNTDIEIRRYGSDSWLMATINNNPSIWIHKTAGNAETVYRKMIELLMSYCKIEFMPEQQPSVGRIVHLLGGSRPLPAIIVTFVEGNLNIEQLSVFTTDGHTPVRVMFNIPHKSEQVTGQAYWDWPPRT